MADHTRNRRGSYNHSRNTDNYNRSHNMDSYNRSMDRLRQPRPQPRRQQPRRRAICDSRPATHIGAVPPAVSARKRAPMIAQLGQSGSFTSALRWAGAAAASIRLSSGGHDPQFVPALSLAPIASVEYAPSLMAVPVVNQIRTY